LVEDDPDISNIYSLVLKKGGYNVETAMNGNEALTQVLSFQPDIILLDIMIPDIDGLTVLKTIRTAPTYSQTQPKVLVMSNLAKEDVKEQAKQYGAQGYVVKSNIVPSDLVSILQELQNRPNTQDQPV